MVATHPENFKGIRMNAPHLLYKQLAAMPVAQGQQERVDFVEYWDIVVDNRWLIFAVAALAIALGAAYAVLARPVYQANLLIQVEDTAGSTKNLFGEAAGLFDVKTAATAEMEILRSRMVIGQAVDSTQMYLEAKPRYVPFVGAWLAGKARSLSQPGILGLGGFVYGSEKIDVGTFTVPPELEGSRFRLTAQGAGAYSLTHGLLDKPLTGKVGVPLVHSHSNGTITLTVNGLQALAGADFDLVRHSRLATIENLQDNLKLKEKGVRSGVIEATLQSIDPRQLTLILNEVGRQYVRQNIERKAAEAQKTLAFLDVQLPQFKKQLDQAEEAYNRYRNQQGTVSLDEEAKLILSRSVDLQSKLLDAQQKRRELVARFTAEHPLVRTIDDQLAAWNREISALNDRVRGLPSVQQDAVRLERDVKVNNELYSQLRNNALQLQLIREGKIGNVRLIDEAALPEDPVKPNRPLVLIIATALGLLGGVLLAVARNAFFRGIRDPQEIEENAGLNVYSTIPLSAGQELLAKKVANREPGLHLLAHAMPHDPAVESLRSLRTALQFAMLEAPNNRILITGATPGVGKSFVSANLAAILASGGKRVLLIDADLRKGYLNHFFGLPRANGLSDLMAGSLKPSEAIHRQVMPNLDLMTTGVLPPNPAELMVKGVLAKVLEFASEHYDLVIIDTAPVLVAADTVSVAPHAGTLLLVARADQTQMGEIHECAKRLSHAGKGVSGVLFNAMDLDRRHYGSYGYKYGRYRYRRYNYEPNPEN